MVKFNDRLVAAHGPPDARWTLTEGGTAHRLWLCETLVQEGPASAVRAAYGATLPPGHWLAWMYHMIAHPTGAVVAEMRQLVEIHALDDGTFSLRVLGWEMMRGDRDSVVAEFNRFDTYDNLPPSN